MCRMSSKDKITVQDQSKEKGVSGSLQFPEERESSSGKQPPGSGSVDGRAACWGSV